MTVPTPLAVKLTRMIEADGPINVATFLALALGDLEYGYYQRQEAIGAKGDFTTAPEISQMFGELIAVYCIGLLDRLPVEHSVTLAEFGPGRGTLMVDVLCTLQRLRPAAFARLHVALVETSARMQALQQAALRALKQPTFYESISELPKDQPLIAIGNEFLDALPIRQFIKIGAEWRERVIGVVDGQLAFGIGAAKLDPSTLPANAETETDGTVFELAPARESFVAALAAHITHTGGAALLIDYGHLHSSFGDTLQAVRNHAYATVLSEIGLADITSHVDFAPLMTAAKSAGCVTEAMTQSAFLLDLGLLERAGQLGTSKSPSEQDAIRSAALRLAGTDMASNQMGNLFKVLAFGSGPIVQGGLPAPFGSAISSS
jgi:NADH dehydrogenase [ubiquinone] 1 alpha subcomplex assembly factor 7